MRNWKEVCAKCADGEIEPTFCEYYGEPNGCNSPTYQEHPPVNNAAAMREALERLDKLLFVGVDGYVHGQPDMTDEIERTIKSALSAPVRNCDLYASAAEALKAQDVAFNEDNFKNGECKLGCPGCDDGLIDCKILWLFAPAAQEGGAK